MKLVKTEEKNEKATKGRAPFIHSLRDAGTSKPATLAKTKERFHCSKSLFERIWKRKALAQSKPAKAKVEKSTLAKRAATKTETAT
jgi:hypothetical protein